ncbi:MAG: NADP-dependent phosphogluconate dehydrogenase [Pyrinomonadaceae bacterium]
MEKAKFGMIGLGVMGRNFLLNVAENGFRSVGYDLDSEKVTALNEEGKEFDTHGVNTLPEFIDALETPRRIMLLVPAGKIVDSVMDELKPHLEPGDLIIDGGNSHFPDTERREKELNAIGLEFLGVGVSGGAEGARRGPSIMIGGKKEAYELVRPILEGVSAKVNGEPCAAHVGNGSAGHFVKMVHNGIEYGLMQLISETYDLLKRGFGMDNGEMADHFEKWNKAELNSFLIEITEKILRRSDPDTGEPLLDKILDTAGQKGTGKWTSQAAMDLGIPIPTIDSAVSMRQISAQKSERIEAAKALGIILPFQIEGEMREPAVDLVRQGLHLAFIITFAQGMSLLRVASEEKEFELDLSEIAKIWRGGCIIRASLLEEIRSAFAHDPGLENLLTSEKFIRTVRLKQGSLKAAVIYCFSCDVPALTFSSALNYLKSFATERLPANMLQAQRDFFGAHTYQRIDKEGIFHTEWEHI